MSPEEAAHIALKQHALAIVLIEIIAKQYLAHPDPTQAAVDHRASLRKMLSIPVPGLDQSAEKIIKELLGKEVDELLEVAGKVASELAEKQGR